MNQKLCAWSGVVFLLLFLAGFCFLAGFMPPPAPSLSPAEVASVYQGNTNFIRAGMVLIILSAGFVAPWTALISVQLRRIEGAARALTYTQLIAGAAGIVLFTVSAIIWATAAFRPDRSPDLIVLLNDLAWISVVTPVGPFMVQNIAIGSAILQDNSASPVFPRWAGYLNFWVALGLLPGVMGIFFKHGPFAWNGLFVFWIPLTVFGAWYVVMFVLLLGAIRKDEQAAAATASRLP